MLLNSVFTVDDDFVSNVYFPFHGDRNYPFSITTKSWQFNFIFFGGKFPVVLPDIIYIIESICILSGSPG